MRGRWYSLFIRGVRSRSLSYDDWTGTWKDQLRERLLLDDLERSVLVESAAVLPGGAYDPIRRYSLPWLFKDADEDEVEDFDEMYNSAMKTTQDNDVRAGMER